MELDDILNDKVEEKVEEKVDTEVQVEAKTEETKEPIEVKTERNKSLRKAHQDKERDTREEGAGRVRDPETGQYAAKVVETVEEVKVEAKVEPVAPVAPVEPELTAREKAFLRATQEERGKRQELERRLAAVPQAPEQPAEPAKTFWDDPEAMLSQFQQNIQATVQRTTLNTAENIARSRHADFDEILPMFAEVLQNVPGIKDQMLSAADPAEFAYQTGKRHKEYKEMGNIEEYKARVAAEINAKLTLEFDKKLEEHRKLADNLPGSLSNSRGSNPSRPVFSGPPSLDSILSG